MIFDWFFAILILGMFAAIGFGLLLQVVGGLAFIVGSNSPQKPRSLSVRQHYYDFDEDN